MYYFDPDEGMLKNTTVSVGDLSFVLDENGAATVKGASDLAKIVSLGMTYLGQTYKTESDGGDVLSCSGFIKVILQAADIELDGSSYHQYYMASHNPDYEIVDSIEDAMPGDIIFYTSLNCDQGMNVAFGMRFTMLHYILGMERYFIQQHIKMHCIRNWIVYRLKILLRMMRTLYILLYVFWLADMQTLDSMYTDPLKYGTIGYISFASIKYKT